MFQYFPSTECASYRIFFFLSIHLDLDLFNFLVSGPGQIKLCKTEYVCDCTPF